MIIIITITTVPIAKIITIIAVSSDNSYNNSYNISNNNNIKNNCNNNINTSNNNTIIITQKK